MGNERLDEQRALGLFKKLIGEGFNVLLESSMGRPPEGYVDESVPDEVRLFRVAVASKEATITLPTLQQLQTFGDEFGTTAAVAQGGRVIFE